MLTSLEFLNLDIDIVTILRKTRYLEKDAGLQRSSLTAGSIINAHTVSAASRMCGRGSLGKTSFILNKYHLLSGWIYFSQVLSVFISESVVLAFILETTFVLPRLPLPHIRLAAETVCDVNKEAA